MLHILWRGLEPHLRTGLRPLNCVAGRCLDSLRVERTAVSIETILNRYHSLFGTAGFKSVLAFHRRKREYPGQ